MTRLRIIIVTGKLAAEMIKREAAKAPTCREINIYIAPYDVAALLPLSEIEKAAKKAAERGYDIVIIPGLHPATPDALRHISRRYGVVVVKGPKEASSLAPALTRLCRGEVKLEPGASIEAEPTPRDVLEELSDYEHLELPCGLRIPVRPPPISVWLETSHGEASRACHAVILGAGSDWGRAEPRLRKLLDSFDCVGVDSPSPQVLVRAARSGASIILSLHPGNTKLLDELPKGTTVVVIPSEPGKLTRLSIEERIKSLKRLTELARIHSLIPIVDPIVEPPLRGLTRSIEAYIQTAQRIRTPIMAGLANVYELMDADTHGVIALAMSIFAEAGASVVLVSEESHKALMAPEEAMLAAAMTSAAMKAATVPKNLGVDLLALKEKKPLRAYKPPLKGEVVEAWNAPMQPFRRDPSGDLYIYLEEDTINVTRVKDGEPVDTIKARSAEEAYRAAIARGMVSLLDHAAYLGKELAYAEQAVRLRRSYVQEIYGRITHPAERLEDVIKLYRLLLYGSKTTTSYSPRTGNTASV